MFQLMNPAITFYLTFPVIMILYPIVISLVATKVCSEIAKCGK